MRPLRSAESHGVSLSVVSCSQSGELDPEDIRRAITGKTRLIVLSHASNVSGTIMPVADVGAIAREHGISLCVDAAQAAGSLEINVEESCIDLLAFTGHKSLYGPQGTGGLYIAPGLDEKIAPLMMGGTGSASEREEQPSFMPDKYESGTPNTPGIAGLLAGMRFVASLGVHAIRAQEMRLVGTLRDGLRSVPGVKLYGPAGTDRSIAVVSFSVDGVDPSMVAFRLDEEFGIMARSGLHCAPAAHRTIGTFPTGTLRLSLGCFNTEDDVASMDAVTRLKRISRETSGTDLHDCRAGLVPACNFINNSLKGERIYGNDYRCPGACVPPACQIELKGLDENDEVVVLVNDKVARENVRRLATTMGAAVEEEQHGTEIRLRITKDGSCSLAQDIIAGQGPVVTVITSDTMGSPDTVLGGVLMKSFLNTLTQTTPAPDVMILYNAGVKLAVQAPRCSKTSALTSAGVRILVCGPA